MCKALGSIPSERKMPLSVRQSSCGASEEESREAEPNLTVACSLPIITVDLSRPELKVQDGLSPSWLPHTVRKCRGPCPPRRTGIKGATVWVFGGSSPMSPSSAGKERFDDFGLRGIRPITEALEVCPMPFPTPPFSTCFHILQEDQGESSKSRLSQEQRFFN